MKVNIRTKKDIEVSKSDFNNVLNDIFNFSKLLNNKYGISLETILKFENKNE